MLDPQYLKQYITISEVVKQHVRLKRSGSSKTRWIGLCPFHSEKTPSFVVNDDDGGFFKCFGCGEGGDVLTFIQKIDGVDFKDAFKHCKLIAGIKDEYLSPEQRRIYEDQARRKAAEAASFRKWRKEITDNLICYTNAVWRKYRKERRSGEEGEPLYAEAIGKEMALEKLEAMPEKELMEYYKTRSSWIGAMNPGWYLSGRRLEISNQERMIS